MNDDQWMRLAVQLAGRAYGRTSPNPLVGAVLVKRGVLIGRGWHRQAGEPHGEIEALRDARRKGFTAKNATLYVTLEPCCTHGRTPPCTDAIIAAGIKRVVVGATDPNPKHCGEAFAILKKAGVEVTYGVRRAECEHLNEAFNHWIVQRTPFVTVKAAMTLDGKIALANGESKWITGERARAYGMRLREGADAILAGINTILADDPKLTWRDVSQRTRRPSQAPKRLRRIILDALARTPLDATIVSDEQADLTTIVVSNRAPAARVAKLSKRVRVIVAPVERSRVSSAAPRLRLDGLLKQLGAENVTSLLIEGGGEVNASFLLGGFAHRVAFFYAPKVFGGRDSYPAVGGKGVSRVHQALKLSEVEWHRLGADLLLTGRVVNERV
jgi:diaminohydroxyphosphoribosylaminopyrimidine deaminase/5-amino-6-(5-phosphoribosylamino)uracil reductase